ncbi:MAG TPA: SPOR domain-containing protein [Desulfomonilaceae bacterium]|nr:SPOR domain-containing protein [Desulfomonilaceae bacterium]
MARQDKDDIEQEQTETVKKPKRYRFELGFKELFFYTFGLLLALSWMFVFGILVGRGIPLVSSDEISLRAHLMRFLGLGKQAAQQTQPEAPENYDSPKDMLKALDYYEVLTGKNEPGTPTLRPLSPVPAPTTKQAVPEVPNPKTKSPPGAQARSSMEPAARPSQQVSSNEPGPPENASEHFSLLVSSMKDADNAQHLVEQLRSKGYSPRIETLNLSGSGRWNRVLIGFFANREEALRFAAEFNRKEHMEGLVIREAQ